MAVWITGDIHGNPQRFSTDIFFRAEGNDKR